MANIPLDQFVDAAAARIVAAQPQAPAAQQSPQNQTPVQPFPASMMREKPDEVAQVAAAQARAGAAAATAEANRLMKLTFRGEEVEYPEEEVRRLAQIGMSNQRLDAKRAEIEQLNASHAQELKLARDFNAYVQANPDFASAAKALISRRVDPRVVLEMAQNGGVPLNAGHGDDGEGDGGGLTRPQYDPRVEQLQEQIRRLEASQRQTAQSFHQKEATNRIEEAIQKNPFLRTNAEAADQVRLFAEQARETGYVTIAGERLPPEEAIPLLAARQKRMVEAQLGADRAARERKSEAAPVQSAGPRSIPRLDEKSRAQVGYRSMMSGGLSDLMRDATQAVKRGFSGTP